MLTIDPATKAELPRIVEIYNSTVAGRMVTADTEPVTVESRESWFDDHTDKRPIFLFKQDNEVVGWMSFSSFYERPAYDQTVEVSVYIDERFRGQGIGQFAVEAMKRIGHQLGLTTLLAFIFTHNIPSMRLFKKNGFVSYGELPDVAVMDDRYYSLSILGYQLNEERER